MHGERRPISPAPSQSSAPLVCSVSHPSWQGPTGRGRPPAEEAAVFVAEALREPAAQNDDGSPYVNFLHLRGRLLGR
jgi:hypothetical protein